MKNTTRILNFFETNFPLKREGLEELLTHFQLQSFTKGTEILKANQVEKGLRFLNTGIVREYYATTSKETNINFYTRPQFITDLGPFNSDFPTKKYQGTLTDTELLVIDKSIFRKFLQMHQCGKEIINMGFRQLLKSKEQAEYNRITKSPEELYQNLLERKPHWLQHIPQYHIASYLNITPETLSRIRKRMGEKPLS